MDFILSIIANDAKPLWTLEIAICNVAMPSFFPPISPACAALMMEVVTKKQREGFIFPIGPIRSLHVLADIHIFTPRPEVGDN